MKELNKPILNEECFQEVKFYDECTCSSTSNCLGNACTTTYQNCTGNGSPIDESSEDDIIF